MSPGLRQRAFSLIETAIVLGVVGLVVGGIWIAAATVSENMKVNSCTRAVLQTVQNVRRLYAGIPVTDGFFTTAMIAADAIPADFVTSSTTTKNPYGVGGLYVNLSSSDNGRIVISLDSIPKAACLRILASLTGAGETYMRIDVIPSGHQFQNGLKVSVSDASNWGVCQNVNNMAFIYSIR